MEMGLKGSFVDLTRRVGWWIVCWAPPILFSTPFVGVAQHFDAICWRCAAFRLATPFAGHADPLLLPLLAGDTMQDVL